MVQFMSHGTYVESLVYKWSFSQNTGRQEQLRCVGLGPIGLSCQNCMLNVATDCPLQSDHYIRPIYIAQPDGINLKVCYHELSDIHADTEIIVWLGPHSLLLYNCYWFII